MRSWLFHRTENLTQRQNNPILEPKRVFLVPTLLVEAFLSDYVLGCVNAGLRCCLIAHRLSHVCGIGSEKLIEQYRIESPFAKMHRPHFHWTEYFTGMPWANENTHFLGACERHCNGIFMNSRRSDTLGQTYIG